MVSGDFGFDANELDLERGEDDRDAVCSVGVVRDTAPAERVTLSSDIFPEGTSLNPLDAPRVRKLGSPEVAVSCSVSSSLCRCDAIRIDCRTRRGHKN